MNFRLVSLAMVALTEIALGTHGAPAWAQTPHDAVPSAQRMQRATVTVLSGPTEHRGRGVALSVDGRVITPLAAIRGVRDLRVRYPDGRVEHARVLATDPGWAVALLEPAAGRWTEGVDLAAHEPPRGSAVAWSGRDGEDTPVPGVLGRRRTFVGAGGALLRDAWEITPTPARTAAGSAVMNPAGEVVALVVSPPWGASAGAGAGRDAPTTPFGVPASVLRDLRAHALGPDQPWLGLSARELRPGEENLASASCGVRVTEVSPGSPAHRAGLRSGERGDVIVGVDGQPVRNCGELAGMLQAHHTGDVITIQVTRSGAQTDVPVQLDALPSTVVASQPAPPDQRATP